MFNTLPEHWNQERKCKFIRQQLATTAWKIYSYAVDNQTPCKELEELYQNAKRIENLSDEAILDAEGAR